MRRLMRKQDGHVRPCQPKPEISTGHHQPIGRKRMLVRGIAVRRSASAASSHLTRKQMRLVVIHCKQNGYSVYEGRKCVVGFVADRPLTRSEVEALRTSPESVLTHK